MRTDTQCIHAYLQVRIVLYVRVHSSVHTYSVCIHCILHYIHAFYICIVYIHSIYALLTYIAYFIVYMHYLYTFYTCIVYIHSLCALYTYILCMHCTHTCIVYSHFVCPLVHAYILYMHCMHILYGGWLIRALGLLCEVWDSSSPQLLNYCNVMW